MNYKKIITVILLSLIILVAILAGSGYLLLRASLPERSGQSIISGAASPINIFFDDKGIPQVWAETEADAWYAVGWLHGEDRLFQMELTRRIASGRLSEMIGDITLSIDRRQRQIGHRIMAVRDISDLAEPYKGYLQAYVNGVNQAVENSAALPFEFYLLGIDYEPWTIEDCLTIFSFQTWFSNDLQNNRELQIQAAQKFGVEKAAQLFGDYPAEAPLSVPGTGAITVQNTWRHQFAQSLFAGNQMPFTLTRASNAWAVGPQKSLSGKAILASDPHLELSRLPQFWYVLGVHTRDGQLDALGITSPGLPFVTMGHNGKAAWAFTAGGVDVMDTYAEQVNPQNPNEYRVMDGYEPFTRRTEYIAVSGWDHPDTLEVKTTRHGPVLAADSNGTEVYALHWAGFDFSTAGAIPHLFRLAHVRKFNEFRHTVTRFAALDANWMYADINGNIGYQLGTPLPVRANGNVPRIMPGANGEYDWHGFRALDDTPYAFNPDQGWLASCNNKPGSDVLPGNYGDTRIRRISELLNAQNKFAARDMAQFQLDTKSAVWNTWRNEAARLLVTLKETEWATRIKTWNGQSGMASTETALLETWLVLLKTNILKDDLGDDLRPYMNRVRYRDRDFERLYFNGDAYWFDDQSTPQIIESREDMAVRAMTAAVGLVGDKTWGQMQQITMAHPLSAVPVLSSLLDLKRGPFARGGTNGSLNNSTAFWDGQGQFNSIAGPSWRLIIDFKDIDRLHVVIPSGQSGHPLSPHFFDFYELWESGAYWTLPFAEETVKQKAVSLLVLVPEE